MNVRTEEGAAREAGAAQEGGRRAIFKILDPIDEGTGEAGVEAQAEGGDDPTRETAEKGAQRT